MSDLKTRFPLYAKLLRLYPAEYREHYENDLLQTTADMLDHAPGRLERAGIWFQLAIDLPVNITRQQVTYAGGVMMQQTPQYVKHGVVLNALLLIPFFVLIPLNIIHPLPVSWSGVGYTGIFILPVIAFLIGVVTLAWWLFAKNSRVHSFRSLLKRLDSHWPLFAAPIVALAIVAFAFGHDSVHCVTDDPVQAIGHLSQTTECMIRG